MDFAALVSFNRVAAHGGYSQASRATKHPKATLARHVRELEEQLGVRLVERGTRALRLTEEGEALRLRTEGLLSDIEAAAQDISDGGGSVRGRLRVSAPMMFAHTAVHRIAADFVKRHPAIQLELSADDRTIDLVVDGYDLVVRANPKPDPKLVGRCFLRDQLLIVAPPDLARPGLAGDSIALNFAPAVLCFTDPDDQAWRLRGDDTAVTIRPQPVVKVSTQLMVLTAVRAGAGAARLPASVVEGDLAEGRLVCWGALEGAPVELWALHTSRRLTSPKVKAFVDFLCDAFADARE